MVHPVCLCNAGEGIPRWWPFAFFTYFGAPNAYPDGGSSAQEGGETDPNQLL